MILLSYRSFASIWHKDCNFWRSFFFLEFWLINNLKCSLSFFCCTYWIFRGSTSLFWKNIDALVAEQHFITLLAGWYLWRTVLWNLSLQWNHYCKYSLSLSFCMCVCMFVCMWVYAHMCPHFLNLIFLQILMCCVLETGSLFGGALKLW